MSDHAVRKGLTRLQKLVDELSDRDEQIRRDVQLFESFFDNFPIPVTIWAIAKDKTIISQRGNGFACQQATTLSEMFLCPTARKISIEHHEKALSGESVDYFVRSEEGVYYAKLIPRYNMQGEITGVTGISWDVTSNAVILSCLENIHEITGGRRGQYKEIHEISERGLTASRLRLLLDESEEK